MRCSMPAGALSIRASTVRSPSRQLTHNTTTETPSAAIASPALRNASPGNHSPAFTAIRPAITTAELQMSVWKCRASASSAWLLYFLAVRERTRDREASIAIEVSITANDHNVTSTSPL